MTQKQTKEMHASCEFESENTVVLTSWLFSLRKKCVSK